MQFTQTLSPKALQQHCSRMEEQSNLEITYQHVEVDPRVSKDEHRRTTNDIDETVIMPNSNEDILQKPLLMKVVKVDLLRDSLDDAIQE